MGKSTDNIPCDNLAELAASVLSPLSEEVVESCSFQLPYPINPRNHPRWTSCELINDVAGNGSGIAELFYEILSPHYRLYDKHREKLSTMSSVQSQHSYKCKVPNDFSAMRMDLHLPLDWFAESLEEMCSGMSADAYAVASSPGMVFLAEELGMCSIRKTQHDGALPNSAIVFSPGYIDSSQDISNAEKRLSQVSYKMFDEREHPEMFEMLGTDSVGRTEAVFAGVPTIGLCAEEIERESRKSLEASGFDVIGAFAEANEGWGSSIFPSVASMLVLPSDPPEVREYVRNFAVRDPFTRATGIRPSMSASPPIVQVLVARAKILPAVRAYAEIKHDAAGGKGPNRAVREYGESLAMDARYPDIVEMDAVIDRRLEFYEELGVESYLDALASGVPLEDVLA